MMAEHGRLIDADALEPDAEYDDGEYWAYSRTQIENAPTIEPEQRWIPCSERLPQVGEDVLFSVCDMFVAEGCLRDDGNWWQFRWDTVQLKEHVTAWMPLPDVWKGVKNDK